ncbi:hypothetical protein AB0I22_01310 [Streptomyces sp. NPDC050610]|uniref:DUF4190 domain-containing protein n=1 Tax=Streptomyces sp. NPDC050610 TaxID=3157097 RepID=UPI00343E718D
MTFPAPPGDQRSGGQRPGGQGSATQEPSGEEQTTPEAPTPETPSQEQTTPETPGQDQAAPETPNQEQAGQEQAGQEQTSQEQTSQEPAGQEHADQAPWGPPPPGPTTSHWSPYPVPAPSAPDAMGIAALVLGIVGVSLGLAIILFWMSWIPALLAVIFGSIGLSRAGRAPGANKGMALTGVILGAAGLLIPVAAGVFAVAAVKAEVDDRRSRDAAVKADEAAEREKKEREEKARHLSFGEAYTFGNGLKVTVAKPKPYAPDDFVLGHAKGNKAIEVTITVVNTGKDRLPIASGLPSVNDADGASTELVIDGSGRQKVLDGYVLPGKEAVGKYAFSLPPDAADRVEVEFTPDAKQWQDSYWSGPN